MTFESHEPFFPSGRIDCEPPCPGPVVSGTKGPILSVACAASQVNPAAPLVRWYIIVNVPSSSNRPPAYTQTAREGERGGEALECEPRWEAQREMRQR